MDISEIHDLVSDDLAKINDFPDDQALLDDLNQDQDEDQIEAEGPLSCENFLFLRWAMTLSLAETTTRI